MTITTITAIEEFDRASAEHEHERFQLEEITRHYESRRLRRAKKIDLLFKLAAATSDCDKSLRYWEKVHELQEHDKRDYKRWSAALKRCNELSDRWVKVCKAFTTRFSA